MTCHVVFTHVGAQCIFKHLMCHIRGFGILLKSQLFVIQTWASCYANTPHSFEHDRTSTEDAAMLMWNLEPKWKKDQKGKKCRFFFIIIS